MPPADRTVADGSAAGGSARQALRSVANAEPVVVLFAIFAMVEVTHFRQLAEAWFYGLLLLAVGAAVLIAPKARAGSTSAGDHQTDRRSVRSSRRWEDGLLLVTALAMTVSTLLSTDPDWLPIAVWLSGILWAIYGHRRFGRGYGFGVLLLAGTVVVALSLWVSYFQLTSPDPRVMEMVGGGGIRMNRSVGLFRTANVLGSWLVLFLPLLLITGLQRFGSRRYAAASLYGGLTVGSLFLLLRNLSRLSLVAGILVITLCILIVGLRRLQPRQRGLLALGAVALGIASIGFLLWFAKAEVSADDRYARLVQAKIQDSSDTLQFRLSLQKRAFEQLPEHIWLGVGYRQNRHIMPPVGEIVDTLSPRLQQRYRSQRIKIYAAHQLGLMLALEAGLIACLCFLASIGLTLIRYARRGLTWSLPTHALAISVGGWLFLSLGYNITYTQQVWPLGLLMLGAFRGALSLEAATDADV